MLQTAENEGKSVTNLGILMVATNDYLSYWKDAMRSVNNQMEKNLDRITIHLFTNRSEEANEWARQTIPRIRLVTHPIRGWGWPEATLLRFSFFTQAFDHLTENLLMYLDVDMLVVVDFYPNMANLIENEKMSLVLHPAFNFGDTRLIKFCNILKSPRLFKLFLLRVIRLEPGFGDWERDNRSTAFLPRVKRKKYFHGAIWLGTNASFKRMCEVLKSNIELDSSNNIISKWHDESHLNWFGATFPIKVLGTEFSCNINYPYLKESAHFIQTVEKNLHERTATEVENGISK
jgi:hypothetical protein